MAFGYLSSRASSSLLKTKLNLPLVLMLSVLPDADLIVRGIPFIQHRGATHSILSALIVFTPFFIIYRKQAIPYFIALVQHGLIGDYIAGGRVQLLWPVTNMYFGTSLDIRSVPNQAIEWTMFLVATILLIKTRDYREFFEPRTSNLILLIPTLTVLLPTLLSTPMEVPPMLIPPHVFYLILFTAAILIEIFAHHKPLPDPQVSDSPGTRRKNCSRGWGRPLAQT
jgi:membrane-bound metal-dependent hydrolase YbcI (DUF457 family)